MVVLRTMAQNPAQTQSSSLRKINDYIKHQAVKGVVDADLYGVYSFLHQNGAGGGIAFFKLNDKGDSAEGCLYAAELAAQESSACCSLLSISPCRKYDPSSAHGALREFSCAPAPFLQSLPSPQRVINALPLAFFATNHCSLSALAFAPLACLLAHFPACLIHCLKRLQPNSSARLFLGAMPPAVLVSLVRTAKSQAP